MTADSVADANAPVLIAGGGLVGLSTAMFLAQQGIASIALERLRHGSPVPRAAHFHLRTLELFRQAGIEDDVKRTSEEEFLPEGAIIAMDSLAGRKLADIIGSLNAGVEAVSPCRRLFITQPGLEPILRRRARQAGATVLEGHELVDFDQDARGVTVTARDVDTGRQRTLRGAYLVGADGAHSTVREQLEIPVDGRGVFSNSITIYFEADLRPQMLDKPISVIYINNPAFGGFFRLSKDCRSGFLVVNTVGDPKTNPDAANAASDVSEQRLVDFVRTGAGVPDLAVKITGLARWRATSDVARHYQHGRVFLAGDAAHVMPPNGGFGGNTGIHDAHNLGWKLAAVLRGVAQPTLLESYEPERKRVGKFTVEQAYTRYVTRTATYLGATDFQPLAPDFNIELGYLYRSPAIIVDGQSGDEPEHGDPVDNGARPGARAPHVWVQAHGQRVSTLDLFGRGFVLLTTAEGNATWRHAAGLMLHTRPGLVLDCYAVGVDVQEETSAQHTFADAYGLESGGAVLVRPDGFVAWKTHSMPERADETLAQALDRVLGNGRAG
jgi:2-polyprenyl-6-methoxyphenol hydroxylase-like FAD-dependent oxidoreductase